MTTAGSGPRTIDTPEALRVLMGMDFAFSDQQFAAITAPLAPQVVIAGAGSGKTTVMAARVVWLVATGRVRTDQVLGLTFTNKAAAELATRIRGALRAAGLLLPAGLRGPRGPEELEEPEEPTVATYNAFAANLLAEEGLRIGHEPDTRVIADAARYQLAARAVARYPGHVELLSDHPPTVIGYLLALDGAMTEHLVRPDEVRRFQERERPRFEEALALEAYKTKADEIRKVLHTFGRREELLGLVEAYRRLKRELGLMDFSDQIELAARLATQRPEVGAALRERYRIVLLDEYQDTSVAQALMLSRLFSGPAAAPGRGHPVTAVGDPHQAIYGWRGASVSNILRFGEDFPAPEGADRATTYPLTVNRRSDRRILEVANELAAPLYAQFPTVGRLQPKPEAADGVVRVAVHRDYDDELAWLPAQVQAARDEVAGAAWSRIGVLTRDNAHAAGVFDALTAAEIPVEIVGLQGLLRLPEVAEIVATLTLLHDLTANAAVLTLLTGPRWAVGARDLALLGQRARTLAGHRGGGDRDPDLPLADELRAAVEGADPTELVSLCDALGDPGDRTRIGYSAEAYQRFGLLAEELRQLRRHASEPLLDLVRRIIDTTGLDVELASSPSPAAQARRDNLDLFVKAVADFQAVDGEVSLPALLAYLQAEDEYGAGLDVATPTDADSVKLLTVHRAKGLEWDAVFLVGVAEDKFPTGRTRTKWTAGPGVLPTPLRGDERDLPGLAGPTCDDLRKYADEVKDHERQEELRLGYVAVTRARHLLVVSSYCWSAERARPLGPSPYQDTVRKVMATWGEAPELWEDKPAKGEPNPLQQRTVSRPWPVEAHHAEVARRRESAQRVRLAAEEVRRGGGRLPQELGLTGAEADRVARWDAEIDRLLAEARSLRATTVDVPLPSSLSATALARLRDDPQAVAAELARPMPRRPSAAARFGTRFHAWVEARFGEQLLLEPDELPGRADVEIDDESDLKELVDRFSAGPFGDRTPVAIEPPFALVLAGQVVRGRIDAVYVEGDGYLLVDWKTNRRQDADPLQLAVYRVAWAELTGVPLESVRAGFYYVRSGDLVLPRALPDRVRARTAADRAFRLTSVRAPLRRLGAVSDASAAGSLPEAGSVDIALTARMHDRAGVRRDDEEWLAKAWADPSTRMVPLAGGRFPVDADGAVAWREPAEDLDGTRVFLGIREDQAHFALLLAEAPEDDAWTTFRKAGPALSREDAGLMVHAVALGEWHAAHRHCPRCGGPLHPALAGHVLVCGGCGRQQFPRADPAVIMLVTDGDRALLGRQPSWPAGRYSTLAGFVDPGESLEEAVAREVAEEVGVQVTDVTYFGNQPWPFPSSLMVGFFARAVTTAIHVDQDEISDARWLTREELRREAEAGTLVLPGGISISRALVEAWYGGPLPGQW